MVRSGTVKAGARAGAPAETPWNPIQAPEAEYSEHILPWLLPTPPGPRQPFHHPPCYSLVMVAVPFRFRRDAGSPLAVVWLAGWHSQHLMARSGFGGICGVSPWPFRVEYGLILFLGTEQLVASILVDPSNAELSCEWIVLGNVYSLALSISLPPFTMCVLSLDYVHWRGFERGNSISPWCWEPLAILVHVRIDGPLCVAHIVEDVDIVFGNLSNKATL